LKNKNNVDKWNKNSLNDERDRYSYSTILLKRKLSMNGGRRMRG
jgi:hypothetical protein